MTEIKVEIGDRSFRFRENTDVGTYYQVFTLEELDMIVRFTGFGSLGNIWKAAGELDAKNCSQAKSLGEKSREYVRGKLFAAVGKLSDAKVKRV